MLASLAITGGAGALVGGGTGALFTDRETFTNNGITASTTVAGQIDLDVDPEVIVGETTRLGTAEYTVTLPENSDTRNNPAYPWIRLQGCPGDTDLAGALWVELSVECDGERLELVSGNLLAVAETLQEGIPLDADCESATPGEQRCLEPDEELTVVFDWALDDDFTFDDGEQLDITFEFAARQCRYNDGTASPFEDDTDPEDCGDPPDTKGISFLAFCSTAAEDGDDIQPSLETIFENDENDENDEDGPVAVHWSTEKSVDYVVVKSGATGESNGGGSNGGGSNGGGSNGGGSNTGAGLSCKYYNYMDEPQTEGVVSTRNWSDDSEDCDPSNPCPKGESVKLEYEDGEFKEE